MSSVDLDLVGLSMIQIFQLSFLFVAYKLDYMPRLDLTRETTLLVNFIGNPSPQRKSLGIPSKHEALARCWAYVCWLGLHNRAHLIKKYRLDLTLTSNASAKFKKMPIVY